MDIQDIPVLELQVTADIQVSQVIVDIQEFLGQAEDQDGVALLGPVDIQDTLVLEPLVIADIPVVEFQDILVLEFQDTAVTLVVELLVTAD